MNAEPGFAEEINRSVNCSADEGVTPDVYISDAHHLYDRPYLENMINNLD